MWSSNKTDSNFNLTGRSKMRAAKCLCANARESKEKTCFGSSCWFWFSQKYICSLKNCFWAFAGPSIRRSNKYLRRTSFKESIAVAVKCLPKLLPQTNERKKESGHNLLPIRVDSFWFETCKARESGVEGARPKAGSEALLSNLRASFQLTSQWVLLRLIISRAHTCATFRGWVVSSGTRLGPYWRFWGPNGAQILATLGVILKDFNFRVETAVENFGQLFEKDWATFYSTIWSHWRWVQMIQWGERESEGWCHAVPIPLFLLLIRRGGESVAYCWPPSSAHFIFKKEKHFRVKKCTGYYFYLLNDGRARSVTRLGDSLVFGQLFKAFGYNWLAQISHILRQF